MYHFYIPPIETYLSKIYIFFIVSHTPTFPIPLTLIFVGPDVQIDIDVYLHKHCIKKNIF